MKKILILLLIFVIKLNAYEYLVYESSSFNLYYTNEGSNLSLHIRRLNADQNIIGISDPFFFTYNNGIKNHSSGSNYISSSIFDSYLKSDLNFLNDFYTKNNYTLQALLNYFYNDSSFNRDNYIYYENYEILYNDDGLAVESIVNGLWAGLYDDSQKSKSGALYNKSGSMVYYNGKAVTATTSFLVWLQKLTDKVVLDTFAEIHRSFISGIIAAVVLVLAIVRLVLELLPTSITPRRRRYYGGGRGSLPDYGDGRQVAASVRARLAAKNKALKERANGGSAVHQSNINAILFDLENER